MGRTPGLLKNPEKMNHAVVLLHEASSVARLTQEELAKIVGVSLRTISYWFAGKEPMRAHEVLIWEAIKKIDALYPQPKMKEVRPGVFAGAWWGKMPKPTEDDEKYYAEIDRFFKELEAKSKGSNLTNDDYLGFQNVLAIAHKYHVKLPKIK